MLTGFPLFENYTRESLRESLENQVFKFPKIKISLMCLKLLNQTLISDENKRISMQTLIHHKYFEWSTPDKKLRT